MHEEFSNAIARKVGLRMSHARAASRVTLPDLARQTGLPMEQLKAYEVGLDAIAVDDLERIAMALRLPAAHFLETCALCGQE